MTTRRRLLQTAAMSPVAALAATPGTPITAASPSSLYAGLGIKPVINGVGAITTLIVLLDIAFEKFLEGAWVVILLVAILVVAFRLIHIHYLDVSRQLKMRDYALPVKPVTNTVLVLVPSLHRGVMPALEFAQSLSPERCGGRTWTNARPA